MDQLRDVVIMIAKKDECVSEQSIESRAEIIAQSALKYMLLSVSPNKDMLFDPNKSVSFEGNTGPYLQYACVRIKGIVDKASKLPQLDSPGKSISDKEFKLVKMLLLFPEMVKRSAKEYDPSILASGLYEIAQAFSTFYVECPVIHDGRANSFRLNLCMATRQVLSNGLVLLDIGIPDKM
jgi:arginyl-tRNA synthetase